MLTLCKRCYESDFDIKTKHISDMELFYFHCNRCGYETEVKRTATDALEEFSAPASDVRKKVLLEAKRAVCEDRNHQYGEPEDNFCHVARLWSGYLNETISDMDVANMMILFKVARIATAKNQKLDSFVDIAGYASCGASIAKG